MLALIYTAGYAGSDAVVGLEARHGTGVQEGGPLWQRAYQRQPHPAPRCLCSRVGNARRRRRRKWRETVGEEGRGQVDEVSVRRCRRRPRGGGARHVAGTAGRSDTVVAPAPWLRRSPPGAGHADRRRGCPGGRRGSLAGQPVVDDHQQVRPGDQGDSARRDGHRHRPHTPAARLHPVLFHRGAVPLLRVEARRLLWLWRGQPRGARAHQGTSHL
mmetsp:Transcript_12749/g.40299  ORF Transcript_12749/g.40299 Transcript_12749/m.40299 type:complete len:215 (+) Transcript_12749:618-1262(+)